jgi:thiol-disulfide isomerase/thioredoxin
VTDRFRGKVSAPDFPPGLDWLNVERPLSLAELRGKVVLLDFWTYCCINCLHMLPLLHKLQEAFPQEVVVLGVHSAKFAEEKCLDCLRQAVQRHHVSHPVVNDRDFLLWRAYALRAWPSLVIIDPEGKVIGVHSGEFQLDALTQAIRRILLNYDYEGKVNRRPLSQQAPAPPDSGSPLSFPAKILADSKGGRLFIADTGHHQIRICSLDGLTLNVIGSGEPGFANGTPDKAQFRDPQGLELQNSHLLVADTGNHAIRRIDLQGGYVTTVAGTGEQSAGPPNPGVSYRTALNSPWDLALFEQNLLIAMAGSHQLWRLDLDAERVCPAVGSGREGLDDGPAPAASLAQPCGLALRGRYVPFVDSEASALRRWDMTVDTVTTVVGKGLFDFGDQDGPAGEALLQHPQGICVHDNCVYLADTFNNRVKKLDAQGKEVRTVAGTGSPGRATGAPLDSEFWEPGGISSDGSRLFVADTNNHRVCVLDPRLGHVSELAIR